MDRDLRGAQRAVNQARSHLQKLDAHELGNRDRRLLRQVIADLETASAQAQALGRFRAPGTTVDRATRRALHDLERVTAGVEPKNRAHINDAIDALIVASNALSRARWWP